MPIFVRANRGPSTPRVHCRVSAWLLLAGMFLTSTTGCSTFTAQGRNAEGVRLCQQARYPEALQEFQEATYEEPGNADGYYNLAATHHRLGLAERRSAELAQAETCYYQCLDHDPNHRDAHRGLAVLMVQEGRREEAFRLLVGWVDREPRRADPKIELARLYEEFGNRAAAQERLTEALAVEPNSARAWAAMGKIREDLGQHRQALADYQNSLAYDRYQPEVAARTVALQTALAPAPIMADAVSPSRTVNLPPPTWR
ncbi:MAG: tetratricopeptide repeat protein [Thermoguttaceae bacterium]